MDTPLNRPPAPPHETESLVARRDTSSIAAMFNRISRSYDLMNRLMTFGQDGRWRKMAADAARLGPGDRALDVATGTGDMARELAKRVGPRGTVMGVDIAIAMLAIARRKTHRLPVTYETRDVAELNLEAEFDAATVAFGFRNFADREGGLRTMARALKPGGRLVILELVPSHGRLKPLVDVYEHRLIPLIGGVITHDRGAYRYLPSSVAASTTGQEMASILRLIGLGQISVRELNLGTVAIVTGVKPAPSAG